MTHSFPIAFSPAKITQVNFAIEPFDAFTGRIVQQHLKVWVTARADAPERERLPLRIIRNARGQFIVVDLSGGARYFVHVRTSGAGFFDPDVIEVDVPAPAPDDAGPDHPDVRVNRLIRVPMYPAPSYPYFLSPETTLIRGRVVRGQPTPVAVARARIWVNPPADAGPPALPFATFSDDMGSFALPIRLPPVLGMDMPAPVSMALHVLDDDRFGNPPAPIERQIDFTVGDGQTLTLPTIDLTAAVNGLATARGGEARVRGVIVRTGPSAAARPVMRARISAALAAPAPPSMTQSDEFGRFNLRILLPPGLGIEAPVGVTIRIEDDERSGNPPSPLQREVTVPVQEGRRYAARSPIDLTSTNAVQFVND